MTDEEIQQARQVIDRYASRTARDIYIMQAFIEQAIPDWRRALDWIEIQKREYRAVIDGIRDAADVANDDGRTTAMVVSDMRAQIARLLSVERLALLQAAATIAPTLDVAGLTVPRGKNAEKYEDQVRARQAIMLARTILAEIDQ